MGGGAGERVEGGDPMSAVLRSVVLEVEGGATIEIEGNRIGARVTIQANEAHDHPAIRVSTAMTRDKVRELRDFLTGLLEDSGAKPIG